MESLTALASDRGVDHVVVDDKASGSERADEAMLVELRRCRVELAVLAGYLRKIGPRTLHAFSGRMINTHPAPVPRFGGQGSIYLQCIDSGEIISTVHGRRSPSISASAGLQLRR